MRYLIYARKSSESDDKQAQSIEDQLSELRTVAEQRGLAVAGEYTEARSAKAPGNRPVFAELIGRIQSGEAEAILVWHCNRLFRNPVDFGTVSWLLQTGALKEIHTPGQIHRTGDNVLLLSVENGMANQYILDLRKAVVRGLESKVKKGWFPHKAPEGYVNVEGEIHPDREKFGQVRRIWDMALSGMPVREILLTLEGWGYRTKRYKKAGGTPISRATLYNLLGNIFYAGYFVRSASTYQGAHRPMVTLTEFFAVQKRLKTSHRRFRRHEFAFSGLITCGHCGCMVVGEHKRKALRDGTIRHYTYYSCSNARGGCRRTVIREEEIERRMADVLERLTIRSDFVTFAHEAIKDWREREGATREQVKRGQADAIRDLERRQERLIAMKIDNLLSDAEFLEQKARLRERIVKARMEQQRTHEAGDADWGNMENALQLMEYGKAVFEGGTPAVQRLIAETLGACYVLTDGSLAVELKPLFGRVAELKEGAETGSDNTKQDTSGQKCLVWWNMLDAIRTGLLASETTIPRLIVNVAPPCPAPR